MLAIHKGHSVKIVVPIEHDKRVLSRLQLFRNVNLGEPAIENLLSCCAYREVQNGESLLSTDKENHYLYVVARGRCAIILGQS